MDWRIQKLLQPRNGDLERKLEPLPARSRHTFRGDRIGNPRRHMAGSRFSELNTNVGSEVRHQSLHAGGGLPEAGAPSEFELHRELNEPGQVALRHCARNAAEIAAVHIGYRSV